MKKLKNAQDCIDFLYSIPADKFTKGTLRDDSGRKCLLGHLGYDGYTPLVNHTRTHNIFLLLNLFLSTSLRSKILEHELEFILDEPLYLYKFNDRIGVADDEIRDTFINALKELDSYDTGGIQ